MLCQIFRHYQTFAGLYTFIITTSLETLNLTKPIEDRDIGATVHWWDGYTQGPVPSVFCFFLMSLVSFVFLTSISEL